MTKIDLKDAYFMFPIHTTHRWMHRLSVRERHYQFTCLPVSLSCVPWVFTKTLRPVTTMLRELGVRLVIYVDNILIMAETREQVRDHNLSLIYLLENLGFIIHPVKSLTNPTQEIEFLGMQVDSCSIELRVPGQKLKQIRPEAVKMAEKLAPPTAQEVSHLVGKQNSHSQAIPPGPLFAECFRETWRQR